LTIEQRPLGQGGWRAAARALLLAALSVPAAERSAYLVVEDPTKLTVLDAYEQTLDAAGRKALLPYAPFRIVENRMTLGDQITEALSCRYQGETYYLLRGERGELLGLDRSGYHKVFSSVRVLGDTLRVTRDRAVLLARRYPMAGERIYLAEGDIVLREFAYGNGFCVRLLGRSPRYGWCSAAAAAAWKPLEEAGEGEAVLSNVLADRIVGRFSAANDSYARYFAHFNRVTEGGRKAPRWEHEREGSTMRFTLVGEPEVAERLERSTAVLLGEVRNLLLGKSFAVEHTGTSVVITPAD
jgi:hypothetical protein